MVRAAAAWPALLALALLPLICSALPNSPRIFHPVTDDEIEELITLCFTDVFQGVYSLVRSLTSIREAVLDCKDTGKSREVKRMCAGSIFDILSDMAEAVSYLSATGSDCVAQLSDKSYCSGDISALTASIFEIADFSTEVKASCSAVTSEDVLASREGRLGVRHRGRTLHEEAPSGQEVRGVPGVDRPQRPSVEKRTFNDVLSSMGSNSMEYKMQHLNATLRSLDEHQRLHQERAIDLSACVTEINVGLGATIRAAVAITEARKVCNAEKLKSKRDQRICTVDLMGAVGSFTMAIEFFAYAADHCPLRDNFAARCVGDIMELVTAITSIIAASVAMPLTCKAGEHGFDEGVAPDRRLAGGANGTLAVLV